MSTEAATHPTGGSFYTRTPSSSFTPEDFGPDAQLVVQAAEQFSRREVLPVIDRIEKLEDGLVPELMRKAGDLGLCGIDVAEAYGGYGMGKNLAARCAEFLSLNASFSVTFGVSCGMGQFATHAFGTDEQCRRYLPHTSSGRWISAYALSEPNSGTDALSATTRAERRGDSWVLNGTKMWISNAKWAELFTVFAKVDGEHFTAFLVERSHPGVSISREEHKLGLKGSSTARLILEGAKIPLENLLYEQGKGHQVAFNCLNVGRFKLSAMSLGPARHALELAAAYTQDRRQFGKPIGEFGLVRQKLAMMAARFFAAESMIYRTGAMIDGAFEATGGTVEGNKVAAEQYSIECSACKVIATEAEGFIVDEALQCFGGYGFAEEFPIARHYRDARVSRIYEGTNEINRLFVSDRLRRRIAEGRVESRAVGDSFLSELCGRAMALDAASQVAQAACSDIIMLAYAEQSARLRAARRGGVAIGLHAAFENWANVAGAAAYQALTGESVTVPSTKQVNLDELALAVAQRGGPIA